MKKAIITEHQHSKLIQQHTKELRKSPYGRRDFEMMKEMLSTGYIDNVEMVFTMLKNYPTVLERLIRTTFGDLLSLAGLEVSKEGIVKLINLEYLHINHKQLTSLPESIRLLQKLEILSLDENQLTSLPESIGELRSLKNLDLNENQLTSLPESLGNLQNLKRLYLSDNKLTVLPESLGNLQNLEWLFLSKNQLTSLPESLGNLQNLEWLIIRNNDEITSLPESFRNLQKLKRLACSVHLPDSEMKKIKQLLPNCEVTY